MRIVVLAAGQLVDTSSEALGVRRISVGGALALAAWTGFTHAAQLLKSEGSFAGLANVVPYGDINGFFTTDYRAR
jgi:2-methylisocitrate lyase-like PEP mutase family enzyme